MLSAAASWNTGTLLQRARTDAFVLFVPIGRLTDSETGRSVAGSIPALHRPGPGHGERRERGERLLQAALSTLPNSSRSREAEGLVPRWPSSPARQVKPPVCVPGLGHSCPTAPPFLLPALALGPSRGWNLPFSPRAVRAVRGCGASRRRKEEGEGRS